MRPLGQFRPGMPARTGERPHAVYKAEMRSRLAGLAPRSVLDVGCGKGELLTHLNAAGCPCCIGVDLDPEGAGELAARGIEWVEGRAEALPFPDRSFEVVVLEYTAHHLADLEMGLREAARVASRAVIVLEPWYDLTVPSQLVARDYDEWCKAIDRRLGLIHNACPTLGELASPFQLAGYHIDATHRLILHSLPVEQVAREARAHLDRLAAERGGAEEAIDRLLERVRSDGLSDDGALLLVATAL